MQHTWLAVQAPALASPSVSFVTYLPIVMSAAEWLEGLDPAHPVLLYKHSPICFVCFWAERQIRKFQREHPTVAVFMVDVLGQRSLSQDLGMQLDIPHASPQAMLLRGSRAVWHASHWGVSARGLGRALQDLLPA